MRRCKQVAEICAGQLACHTLDQINSFFIPSENDTSSCKSTIKQSSSCKQLAVARYFFNQKRGE
jgi:hypothetical protein